MTLASGKFGKPACVMDRFAPSFPPEHSHAVVGAQKVASEILGEQRFLGLSTKWPLSHYSILWAT